MKISLLVLLSLINLLSAAELRIYKEKRSTVAFGEVPAVSFPLISKNELSESDYHLLKIIAELETFAEPGQVHPFIGDVYYFAIIENGKPVGKLIQFAHIEGSRSGNLYLHDWEAAEKHLKPKEDDSITYIPLYSEELGDILTRHLATSGILKSKESNQSR